MIVLTKVMMMCQSINSETTIPYKRRLGKALRMYGFCYVSKNVDFPKIFV
jgi:hypothetical protein